MSLLTALVVLASCGGQVPTQEEIKQDIEVSRAEQLVRVADTTRAGGDLMSAIQLYRRAAEMRPDWLEPLLRLGETALAANMHAAADAAYARARRVSPESLEAALGQGRAAMRADDPEAALAAFDDATSLAPRDNRGYNGAGIALDLLGRHEEAQERYITGIERAPDNLALKNNLGLSLALDGDYTAAVGLLEEALRSPGAGPETRQNLSLVHGLAGDDANARRIASIDLNEAAVANNLAFYARLRDLSPADRRAAVFGLLR